MKYMQKVQPNECSVLECRRKVYCTYAVETEIDGNRIPLTIGVCDRHDILFRSPPGSYSIVSKPLDARAYSTRIHDL